MTKSSRERLERSRVEKIKMFECELRYENLFESEREDEKCSSVNKRSNLPKVRE